MQGFWGSVGRVARRRKGDVLGLEVESISGVGRKGVAEPGPKNYARL